MSKKHVFSGVTLEVLGRLADEDDGSYVLELDPDRIGGMLIRHTGLGDVVVRFDHDNERAKMVVTILKKPMLVPEAVLLAEMSLALRRASGEAVWSDAAKPAAGGD